MKLRQGQWTITGSTTVADRYGMVGTMGTIAAYSGFRNTIQSEGHSPSQPCLSRVMGKISVEFSNKR